jgi:antitoxin component of MazEF toxin-antitoxin module
MASEIVQSTYCIGNVLPDGHLKIPKTIVEQMGLKLGDKVEVALRKTTSMETEVSIPEETRLLIQELVGTPRSLRETVEALTLIATAMMSHKKQRRLSHLLWKNQEGAITAKEEQELDVLIVEGQEATLRKAKAILALKHLGIDIIPDLEARVSCEG